MVIPSSSFHSHWRADRPPALSGWGSRPGQRRGGSLERSRFVQALLDGDQAPASEEVGALYLGSLLELDPDDVSGLERLQGVGGLESGIRIVEEPFLGVVVVEEDAVERTGLDEVSEQVRGGVGSHGCNECQELSGVAVAAVVVSNDYLYGVTSQVELWHLDVTGREGAPPVGLRRRDRRDILTADLYQANPEEALEVLAVR